MIQNDLISRSALIAEHCDGCDALDHGLCNHDVCGAALLIMEAPAVDAVVIPCKIGDTVWAVRRLNGGHLCAMQSVVSEMQFVGSEMRLSITVRGVCRGEWGKTIFATQEEAEGEIKRRNGHGH